MLLNLSQTAQKLGISDISVKRLVEAGSLPAVPYGDPNAKRKAFRFNESDVQAFRRARIQTHTVTTPKNNGHAVLPVVTSIEPDVPEGYMHTVQAAKVLNWTYQRVIDMVKNGRIESKMIGNRRFIALTDVEKAKAWPKTGMLNREAKATITTKTTVSPNHHASDTPTTPELVAPMPTGLKVLHNRLTGIESHQATIEMRLTAIETALNALVKAFA